MELTRQHDYFLNTSEIRDGSPLIDTYKYMHLTTIAEVSPNAYQVILPCIPTVSALTSTPSALSSILTKEK